MSIKRQNKIKIGIIGFGYVGTAMKKFFPEALVYDKYKTRDTRKKIVSECGLVIICVSTNESPDGSADTSAVENTFKWLSNFKYKGDILIKSTIPPGTTQVLNRRYRYEACFSPEYIGEGKYWIPTHKYPDPNNPVSHGFMIIGGKSSFCQRIADMFTPVVGPSTHFRFVSSTEAELIKYAENTWGATKVIFSHMLRDVCDKIGANWYQVREGWLDDPRVEEMHTQAFPKRGFGGKCFPKDLSAFLKFCENINYDHRLLKAVKEQNDNYNELTNKDVLSHNKEVVLKKTKNKGDA